MQSINITNSPASGQGFYRLVLQPKPLSLILPQGDAFAILGASCGSIQEQVYATGFDPVTGYPTGAVYLKTSCGGSGRGGGYHTTTYTAWAAATWDFAGNVISYSVRSNAVVNASFTATDNFGDILYNTDGLAYLIVPFAAPPAIVTAVQSGDQFLVTWLPNAINPVAVTSSTLTATPVNSPASILTMTVTGSATNGAVDLLQPQTTYQITVVNNALSGPSPASLPVTLTTGTASVTPSAPTNVVASWSVLDPAGATDTLVASWAAADPGDSPIDQYLVTFTPDTGGSAVTQTVTGSTLTAYFGVDFAPNWSVTVQAHNAVGWGPASNPVKLGGL
jgi:Fibronectin type III domain